MQSKKEGAPLKLRSDTPLGVAKISIDVIPLDAETVTASIKYKVGLMPSSTTEKQVPKAEAEAFAYSILRAVYDGDPDHE